MCVCPNGYGGTRYSSLLGIVNGGEGNTVNTDSQPTEGISLRVCREMCDANPNCHSFAAKDETHCYLKDKVIKGKFFLSHIRLIHSNLNNTFSYECFALLERLHLLVGRMI